MSKRMDGAWRVGLHGLAGLALAVGLAGCDRSQEASADYESQLRAEATARANDPAWKPTLTQTAVIRVGGTTGRSLAHNFCVGKDGNLLVCWGGGTQPADSAGTGMEPAAVKVVNPEGKLLHTWPLEFRPQAICVEADGQVIVGGDGKLARLNAEGKVVTKGSSPTLAQPAMSDEEIKELLKGRDTSEAELAQYKSMLDGRRADITGLAVLGEDVFVACAAPKGFGYVVERVDREFKNPKRIVDKLSGCCGQMDISARDGKLWVAHNGRHRVEAFDRDGAKLASFGKRDRQAADGFGGCCEPKNVRLTANGDVLSAESGPPVAIKRFSSDGKFLEVLAAPTYDSGCVRATVDVSPDGQRFYLLNVADDAIHVFAAAK